MTRFGIITLIGTLLWASAGSAQEYFCADPCNSRSQSSVTETPQGPVDGSNLNFTISTTPEPGSPIRLFRNGISLHRGIDFDAEGQQITFKPSQLPMPQDQIEAEYFPSRGVRQRSTGTLTTYEVSSARASDEITVEAGREALTREAKTIAETLDSHATNRDNRSLVQEEGNANNPASLHMLENRLAEIVNKRDGVSVERLLNRDLSGVEGTGDNSLLSPFYVQHRANLDPYTASSGTENGTRSSTGVRDLERAWYARDIDLDSQNIKCKAKKSHKHPVLVDIWR